LPLAAAAAAAAAAATLDLKQECEAGMMDVCAGFFEFRE
jgi:hypothetical protein